MPCRRKARFNWLMLPAAFLGSALSPAYAATKTPTDIVMAIYERPGLEHDPAVRGLFADPIKHVLDDSDQLRRTGDGDCLDPNMALDNVEGDAAEVRKTIKTHEAVDGEQARVLVAFVASGAPHRLEWKLKKLRGAWKVVDLVSVNGEWALSQYNCQ